MKVKEFYFDLPSRQIAQYPSKKRGLSRLMVLDPKMKKIYHENSVNNIIKYINNDVFLVFNNSKVRKSRIYAKTLSGLKVEFLMLDRLDKNNFSAIVLRSKKQNVGKKYEFEDNLFAEIISKEENKVILNFNKELNEDYFEKYGFIPLPPYIKRDYDKYDENRYQTIYSKYIGSSAAATAGLHFSKELFLKLNEFNISYVFITLHVGLGTFLPVRSDNIEEHKMHFENFFIDDSVATKLENAKLRGKKILSIGTTSLRSLESAFDFVTGKFRRGEQKTDLFIYPGKKDYKFKFVDMLFTNFHTPNSTLIMLVSAFAGKDFVLEAYKEAIKDNYKFFSYGDATLFLNHI